MTRSLAARRYAKALLLLAGSQGLTDRVLDDVRGLRALLGASADFRRFVANAIGLAAERQAALRALFEGKLAAPTLKTLLFMDARRRLPLLPALLEAFLRLIDEQQNIQHLEVASAAPLSESQKQALEARFGDRLGQKVVATYRVDPALLGGFRVRAGDTIFDASADAQLKRVRRVLMSA